MLQNTGRMASDRSWLGETNSRRLCATALKRDLRRVAVYLHAYETVSAAREGIGRYINFYNTRRPHSSHQARAPDVAYFASLPQPST